MSYLGRSAKLSRKTQEKVSFLATAGQTVKTGLSYVSTFVEVRVNGIILTDVLDYTATDGNSITFPVALSLNDEVTVISLKTFALADHYNRAEADAQFSTPADVTTAVSALADSAPAALNTLNELAAALGDDVNFSTTVNNSIATKLPKSGGTMTGALIVNDTVTADGLTTSGDLVVNTTGNTPVVWANTTGSGKLSSWNKGGAEKAFITNNGGASFGSNVDVTGSVTADGLDVRASAVGEAAVAKISNEYTGGLAVASMEFGSGGAVVKASIAAAVYNDGYMAFRTNDNTEKMRITAAGLVGVGTSTPDALVSVQRPSNNRGVAGGFSLKGQDGTTQGGLGTDGVIDNYLQILAAQGVKFHTGNTNGTANERMRIDANGNVGIGTSSPAVALDVDGTVRADSTFAPNNTNWLNAAFRASGSYGGGISIVDGSAGWGMWAQTTGTSFRIGQGSTSGALSTKMAIDSSGNVGIGVVNPATKLDVAGAISDADGNVRSGRKNLIINGGFDVWQRGTSFTSGYFADRYTGNHSGHTTTKSTDVPANKGFGSSAKFVGSGSDPYFYQVIEGSAIVAGRAVVFSFWHKGGLGQAYIYDGSYTAKGSTVIETAGSWTRRQITHTFATGTYNPLVRIGLPTNTSNTSYTTGWQVELGSVATDFEHRSYGEELALCQRYFETNSSTTSWFYSIEKLGAGYGRTHIPFMTVKHHTPTITYTVNNPGNGSNGSQFINASSFTVHKNTMTVSDYVRTWTAEAEL